MKKILIFGLLFIVGLSQIHVSKITAAQDNQSGVGQAFNAVQNTIDNLITAKDQNSTNDSALRLAAFQQVINLSVSEAKNLKFKLLTNDQTDDKNISAWKDKMVAALNAAIDYYNQEGDIINQADSLTLNTIQNMAAAFKNWRDKNYLPIADQINSFILIQEEKNAISIAEKRAQKIATDIQKLPKIKGFDPLAMLNQAKNSIKDSKRQNNAAYDAFSQQFIETVSDSNTPSLTIPINNTSSTASSSADTSGLAPMTLNPDNASTTNDNSSSTSNTTSTNQNEISTEVSPLPPPSIKDLIKGSLDKIKDAYQIFIEMSNSVRKLLS